MMSFLKKFWPLFLSFAVAIATFYPLFGLYFAQDDFFLLKMGTASSLAEFFNFFSFKNPFGYQFYRPLTTQVYTFVLRSLFGLEPFYFRLVSFLVFLGNIVLVFKIISLISKRKNVGFLAAFIYSFNASNLGSLSYISAFQEIGMAFFFFLSFWLYLKNKKLAFFTFVLALLSKENAAVFPLIITVYEFLLGGRLGERKWQKVLPFWIMVIFYGILRFSLGLPDLSVYKPDFSPIKVANSYLWYFLWGLGLPEMLIDFVGPKFKIDPRFILWYRQPSILMFSAGFLFLVFLGIAVLKSKNEDKKLEAFFILWFLVGLLPVIFWPWHKFSYYLTVPLLGLVGFFSLLLKNLAKAIVAASLICLLVISFTTVRISQGTYWIISRAKIAKNLINDLTSQYPSLPGGASLYLKNDPDYPKISGFGNSSTQAYFALSGENAIQVLYHDPTIKVYFEDLEKPADLTAGGEEIFPFVAKIRN